MGGAGVKVCPVCFAASVAGTEKCQICGHEFEKKSGARQVDNVDGELVEIDPAAMRAKRLKEQGTADTEAALVELGRKRGYRRPQLWARHVMMSRAQRQSRNEP